MDKLQLYGMKLLPELEPRKFGFINEEISIEENIKNIIDSNNLKDYDYIIIEKSNSIGFKMKWHLDDAVLITHKKDFMFDNQMKISEKKVLHYPNKKPKYSLIIYSSEYNKDFKGGTFEFVDKKIFPKKNMYILFDSREVHRVNKITYGNRKNYLVKFY